ncbi:MAG: glutamine amidotransferase, partial [Chloroflexota bacterium]|nr:glutamine amidotransferase [Chloroflexota bacterium]
VALGTDADLELLEYLSVEGGGRYRVANSPEEIPTITFEEAQSAGSQSVLRGAFTPVQQQPSTILNDIDTASMPAIQGYNFADSRTGAQSVLTSDRGDPLLTKWQFGLGRVVAWTADDGSDFASGWDSWGEYDEFWGNALRWTLPDPANQAVTAEMSRDGRQANVSLDTQTADGNALNMGGARVDVIDPAGETLTLEPVGVGPGLSRVSFDDPIAGAYQVVVRGGELGDAAVTLGGAIPISPEWLPQANAGELLSQLAQRTGGKLHSLDEPPAADLFEPLSANLRGLGSVQPVWHYPLGLALLLFVVEIALRMTGRFGSVRVGNRAGT